MYIVCGMTGMYLQVMSKPSWFPCHRQDEQERRAIEYPAFITHGFQMRGTGERWVDAIEPVHPSISLLILNMHY